MKILRGWGMLASMRWATVTAATVAMVLATSCRVDFVLDVVLEDDGSGLVAFAIGADEEVMSFVDVDDIDLSGIAGSGWELAGPAAGVNAVADSTTVVTLSKRVPSADQLDDVIDQLDQGRLYTDVAFEVDAGLGVTDYRLTLTIDPSITANDFSDIELAELLDGERFGELREVLEDRAGGSLDEAIFVGANVVMPDGSTSGGLQPLAASEATVLDGDSQFVDTEIDARRADAEAARGDFDTSIRRLAIFSGAAAVLALLLISIGWRRRHRMFRQEPA